MNLTRQISVFVLAGSGLFGQAASLSSDVSAMTSQIQAAVNRGDLKTAVQLTSTLQTRLTTELSSSLPTVQARLASAEGLLSHHGSDPNSLVIRLLNLPRLAYAAEQFDKAQGYVSSLLQAAEANGVSANLYTDAIFEAQMIRGQLALRSGDVPTANDALVKSTLASTSASLVAKIGCRFDLASALLAQGQRSAVVQFLQQCQTVRPTEKAKYDTWIAAIKGGATPVLSNY